MLNIFDEAERGMSFLTQLPEASRQGLYQSAAVCGAVVPIDATELTVRAILPQAVRDNAALSMTFHVYKSTDGGQTWRHDVGGTWQGGTGFVGRDGVVNPPITIRYQGQALDAIKGALVRVEMDIPTQMQVGIEAELL